jgi:hypothetical protein
MNEFMSDFFGDSLENKIVHISFRVVGLFVLRPVADLGFVSVFNLCLQSLGLAQKKLTSTLNDII